MTDRSKSVHLRDSFLFNVCFGGGSGSFCHICVSLSSYVWISESPPI